MTKLVPHFSINCIDDTCLHLSIVLYFLDILKIIPIFDQEKLEGVEYIRLLARSNEDSREKNRKIAIGKRGCFVPNNLFLPRDSSD